MLSSDFFVFLIRSANAAFDARVSKLSYSKTELLKTLLFNNKPKNSLNSSSLTSWSATITDNSRPRKISAWVNSFLLLPEKFEIKSIMSKGDCNLSFSTK